jgi:uncharacterized delta-60 repeat protein
MADNIIQEVNSPNILIITDSDQNQITVTQPLTNTIEVATPGPQGSVGPIGPTGPTGASTPFTKISGSDSWFTTSSIQLTGSLQGTASYAVAAGTYLYLGNSSVTSSISWSQASVQELNLNSSPTLTFSNGVLGQTSTLLLKQTEVGQKTVTWPSSVLWSGGTAPSLVNVASVAVDSGFTVGTGFNQYVANSALQSDGKVIVVGNFTSYNGNAVGRIIRLNNSGSIDDTFVTGSGTNGDVTAVVIQSDGKIIIGGFFTSYDGNSSNYIVRLNSNGSYDNTFNIGSGFDNTVKDLAIQSDGKIIVVGDFSNYNATSSEKIIRLNTDGTIDGTFTIGTGFDNGVAGVKIQSDGKIVVVGNISNYDGTSCSGIARLNSSGSADITFITNTGAGISGGPYGLTIQPDDKIIVYGGISGFNGNTVSSIVRINSDGTYDSTFVTGEGFSNQTTSVKIDSTGKILVGGYFARYNGITSPRFVRLNNSGSFDSTFITGTGFDTEAVTTILVQPDNKIITGGSFTSFNGTSRIRLARLEIVASPISYNTFTFNYNGVNYIGSY